MTAPEPQNSPPVESEEEPIPPQLERVSVVVERCLASVLPRYIERHEAKYGRDPEDLQRADQDQDRDHEPATA